MTEQEIMETPIAELGQWGLSVRAINLLELRHGLVYIWQLRGVTRDQLMVGEDIGMGVVRELAGALGRFLAEAPMLRVE